MAGEKPITVRDEYMNWGPANDSLSSSTQSSHLPIFVGLSSEVKFNPEGGLPKHITGHHSAAIFRAIKLNTSTIFHDANGPGEARQTIIKPIQWRPPIQACKAIAMHFIDRQQLPDDEDRYVRVILRAQPFFQNKSGTANVKVAVASDAGIKIYFAKCIVFLKDNHDDYFVVLQWYDVVGREPFDTVSGLIQLVLRPPNVTTSFSVMPIDSVINGALVTKSEDKLWVLLSPRETKAYAKTNG